VSKLRCSVVIPVHDQAALTAQCLDAILAEPPAASFELVVVDDASADSTPEVLKRYGAPVRTIRRDENAGFATACNDGAAAAGGELLVFLNNDTKPLAGWLDALVEEADGHPEAAVIGAKLLFPNDTVQHAGVVVCQDGKPRHLYAGFPADHPAVNKSRPFQAVTAACMLVRRKPFEQAGGFDAGYLNSLEDADLCLRLRERGHGVRLCHRSVLYHLESVSRGRRSQEIARSRELFESRWGDRVERDDVRYYLEDGLLSFAYRDTYPLGVEVSPLLAVPPTDGGQAGRMIELQAARLAALMRETVRLTSRIAELELETTLAAGPEANGNAPSSDAPPDAGVLTRQTVEALAQEMARIEHEILSYQSRVAAAVRGQADRWRVSEPLSPGDALTYRRVKAHLQEQIEEHVPAGATVLVVSRGDGELLELGARRAWHFPRDRDGNYTGYHPEGSADAIERLERLRTGGAGWLAIPETSLWWMEHYRDWAEHLRRHYDLVAEGSGGGLLFRLERPSD
jgi:GT2 family glycosyltransferase